jgi:hypothetical protein
VRSEAKRRANRINGRKGGLVKSRKKALPPVSMPAVRALAAAENQRSDRVSRSVRSGRYRPGPPRAALYGRAKCAYGLILLSSGNYGAGE